MTSRKVKGFAAAAAASLFVMSFGFSNWSSNLAVSGNVSAHGDEWDVQITDLSYDISEGVTAEYVESETVKSFGKEDEFRGAMMYITTRSEGVNVETGLYLVDTREYSLEDEGTVIKDGSTQVFRIPELKERSIINSYSDSDRKAGYEDYCRRVEEYLKAQYGEDAVNYEIWRYEADHSMARIMSWEDRAEPVTAYLEGPSAESLKGEISEDGLTGTFRPVDFSLPGAWTTYNITVTNNGDADAVVSSSDFDFSALDESIYKVSVDDTEKSETLEPGESAVFKFTVQIYQNVESGFTSESSPFTVSLNYAQKMVTK